MSSPLSPRGRGAYQAFTLIELLTVIAVIGILAAITIGVTQGVSRQGRIARAKAELGTLASAMEEYKRHYGDYLKVDAGNETGENKITPGGGATTDRAFNLFRALNGRFAPDQTVVTRQINKGGGRAQKYGKAFINPALFALERDETSDAPSPDNPLPAPATGSGGADPDFSNAILDPWGNRYLYYYRDIGSPNDWRKSGYILYSAGPDGQTTFPDDAGEISATDPKNIDNIYANP